MRICKASEIATNEVESITVEACVQEAVDWLDTTGYDVAPVQSKNGRIIGYVEIDSLRDIQEPNQAIESFVEPITIEEMISPDTGFVEVVNALIKKSFYFLGGHESLDGIITRADLNTPQSRNHIFTRLINLENKLESVINREIDNWIDKIYEDSAEKVKNRYDTANRAGVELPMVTYAQFSTKVHLITNNKKCEKLLGYRSKSSNILWEIKNLRNRVAHGQPIIHNTKNSSPNNNQTTTEDLYELLQEIARLNRIID